MRTEYRKALAEVGQILEYTDDEIINKIPDKFIDYIEENMDKNHKLELQDNKKLKDQNIMLETKEILALIYRDYICSEEEKKELLNDGYNNKKDREMYKINFKSNLF